jgi:pyridoxal phosphate enzyme (YggS family)
MSELANNLKTVLQRINELSQANQSSVRLIAVSKTKPVENIIELYNAGQRYFGENYIDELEKKSNDNLILTQCPDIRWHLIGHLQSNKINRVLTRIPNLDCIQTIDSIELANRLNNNLKQQSKTLNILLQINTSNEEQKSGISTKDFLSLYEHIKLNCSQLVCQGLMTIGLLDNVNAEDDSDFHVLVQCRKELCEKYNLSINDVELSMGMSNDYERAIQCGSTIVRIGSLLFGARH